jgi:PPOX class probable F420-dependent enzyme
VIDESTEFGARAARRLREDSLAWLVTVRADGTPDPLPIWFLWEEESALLYSRPGTRKLRNLEHNPRAALHLEADEEGGDIVIVHGRLAISDDPPADAVPAYVEKYRERAARLGWSPEEFAKLFSVPLRFTFESLSGH